MLKKKCYHDCKIFWKYYINYVVKQKMPIVEKVLSILRYKAPLSFLKKYVSV